MRRVLRSQLPLMCVMLALFVSRATLADHYAIPTGSMRPTVALGDHVIIDKRAFGLRVPFTRFYVTQYARPHVGDVVALSSPSDDRVLLKRVVALPGQRVEVLRGWVRIDGEWAMLSRKGDTIVEALPEKEHEVMLGHGGAPFAESILPDDCYLVLGDNRSDSLDGRSFGCIGSSDLVGKAVGVFMSDHRFVWREL